MSRSPLSHYQELVEHGGFLSDPAQHEAVAALNSIWRELQQPPPRLLGRLRRGRPAPVRGLYLWGGVGRGKTCLMDLFYDGLPAGNKQRIHFHRFMQKVHMSLRTLGNTRDPLEQVARDWASRCRIMCLDEFFVSDIADAMLLGGLLKQLFAHGLTLVTTSNIAPDGLYQGGLQRAKFLPAIDLLKRHTRVLELGGETDYRLRILEQSEIYHHPLDEEADRLMAASFERMTADSEMEHALEINGRIFNTRRRGDGVVWFDFQELCEKPSGAIDYIEIARAFNTVVISNLPQLAEQDSNAARRFITLVDEFYDRNVKLLISAAAPISGIYTGHRLAFEFERTRSRLTEMQSHDYLAKPHLP